MAVDEKTIAPFGLGPQERPKHASEVLKPGEKTVTMVFQHTVITRTSLKDGGFRVQFDPGIQEVPESLTGDWYLKANGVRPYDSPEAKAAIENAKTVEEAEAAVEAAKAALAAAKANAVRAAAKPNPGTPIPVAPAKDTAPAEPVDLTSMTRAQIVAHAAEVHDLDLDPKTSKSDLIAAVQDAQAAKE